MPQYCILTATQTSASAHYGGGGEHHACPIQQSRLVKPVWHNTANLAQYKHVFLLLFHMESSYANVVRECLTDLSDDRDSENLNASNFTISLLLRQRIVTSLKRKDIVGNEKANKLTKIAAKELSSAKNTKITTIKAYKFDFEHLDLSLTYYG
jgi:hypothetical protein